MSLDEVQTYLPVPSLRREFQGDCSKTPQTLHVLQWNTLAQGLSNPEGNFVRVKKETTAYETRRWRILEQIVLRHPDLCALEEVDTYEDFLQHQLPKYGYTCFYAPKSKSPCLAHQHDVANFKGPDGLLLCYKTAMFDEIKRHRCEEPFKTGEGKQFFALLELHHKPSSTTLVFVATHQKAKKPFAAVREQQASSIMQYLSEHYTDRQHLIVAGDCNGVPSEPFYQVFRQAGFSSAYRTMLNDQEPVFTTWKFRARDGVEEEACHCIDYIFYKPDGFTPSAILKLPSKDEIGPNGLPSDAYPSDHLALETIFNIKS